MDIYMEESTVKCIKKSLADGRKHLALTMKAFYKIKQKVGSLKIEDSDILGMLNDLENDIGSNCDEAIDNENLVMCAIYDK